MIWLLKHWGHLYNEGIKNFKLHIYGNGNPSYKKYLRKLSEKEGFADKIIWHGYVNDIDSLYDNVQLVIVPSRYPEPFGLSALEPTLLGIPVIASNMGGLPEVVEDEYSGFLFENENIDNLADKLKRFFNNPDLLKKLGTNAKKRKNNVFNKTETIQKLISIIENI